MSIFEYTAINEKNKEVSGLIESDTTKSARQQLKSQQLVIITIKHSKRKLTKAKSLFITKLSAADIAIITRQLAFLIEASMPINEALTTIINNNDKKHIKKVIGQVRSSLIEGINLAESLQINIKELPQYFISSIEAGERSGKLGDILTKLADEIQQQEKFKKKIATAATYPLVITIVALGVLVFLLTFVVPTIVTVFDDINQKLPALTNNVIAVSNFFSANILQIIILLILFIIIIKLILKQDKIKFKWQKFLGKIPIIGSLIINANAVRFARTLALLHESGTPVIIALNNTANALNYLPMKKAILEASKKVSEGSTIFKAMQYQKALPATTLYMLASGEASGNLSVMLNKVATSQEEDLDNYIIRITSLFEPLMILFMGAIVLLIVLAILLPIFELNQITL